MVNAWSLAASILNGTFDEDYPMIDKEEHSDAWYDYKRNDPNAENPFTDPEDRARAERVVGNGNTASDYPSEFTTLSDNDDAMAHHVGLNYEELNLNIQAHSPYNSGYEQDFYKEELKKMTDSRNKYHENEILEDIKEYVSSTYNGHYTGNKHEFRNVQTIDLMASRAVSYTHLTLPTIYSV